MLSLDEVVSVNGLGGSIESATLDSTVIWKPSAIVEPAITVVLNLFDALAILRMNRRNGLSERPACVPCG